MATSSDQDHHQANDANAIVGEIFSGGMTTGQAIEKLRTRLLDLSGRNGLLNFRHPKGRCLQFINRLNLNLVFKRLYRETKSVSLKHVPEPTILEYEDKRPDARVYAQTIGFDISTEFEPNAENAQGQRLHGIQTLLYPQDLEKQLRRISREAHSAIEETGTNMLFIIFGFLEFYDKEDSDRAMLAPLLALPVELLKGSIDQDTRTYQYTVQHNGEDLTENHTLKEKLKRDFSLLIPEFNEDTDKPESYFQKIDQAISNRKRWRVLRQLSLGMLSFGKLAIWSGLDTKKYPGLLDNELIESIFSGRASNGGDSLHAEDFNVDEHPEGNLQFIFDADSSQHSAIIDVLAGKNLVINGPPGTGKSQTITNIIACALAQGKKILFVSEKLAALEVVRRRLNKANLGHFCLELHSHKTQKKRLLEDIEDRIEASFTPPSQLQTKLGLLQKKKRQLNRYAELMGSSVGNNLGMTIHQIFWAVQRRRQDLDDLSAEVSSISFDNAATWSHDDLKTSTALLSNLSGLYEEIGRHDQEHPWWGFQADQLSPGEDQTIRGILELALEEAERAEDSAIQISQRFELDIPIELSSAVRLANDLAVIAPIDNHLSVELLPRIFNRGKNDSSGRRAATVIDQVKRHLANAIELKNNADAVFGFNQRPTLLERQLIANIPPGFILDGLVDIAVSRVVSELDCFRTAISACKTSVANSLPNYSPNSVVYYEHLKQQCATVNSYGLSTQTIGHVEVQLPKLTGTHKKLLQALQTVSTFCNQKQIKFDGTAQGIATLRRGNIFPELKDIGTPTSFNLETGAALINHPLSGRSIAELRTLIAGIRSEETEIGLAIQFCHEFTERLGLNLRNNEQTYRELKDILQIAVAAPTDLLDYRQPGFFEPRATELLETVERFLHEERVQHHELNCIFYLDDLPATLAISEAISALRNNDGFLALFNSQWRNARNLHNSLSRTRRKLTAKIRAEELAELFNWITSRDKFLANAEYRKVFGELMRGFETKTSPIRRLLDWLTTSRNNLARCNQFSAHIDLLTIDTKLLTSLTANAPRLTQEIDRILGGVEKICTDFGPSLQSGRQARNQSIDVFLSLIANEITKLDMLILHYGEIAFEHVSPSVAHQRFLVKSDLSLVSHELSLLANCQAILVDASGDDMTSLTEQSVDNLHVGLNLLGEKIDKVTNAVQFAKQIAQPLNTFNQLSQLSESYLNLVLSWNRFKMPADPETFPDWNSVLTQADEDCKKLAEIFTSLMNCGVENKTFAQCFTAIKDDINSIALVDGIEKSHEIQDLIGPVYNGVYTDIGLIETTLTWGRSVTLANLPRQIQDHILSLNAVSALQDAKVLLASFSHASQNVRGTLEQLNRYGQFDWEQWQLQCRRHPGVDLPSEIKTRLRIALNASDSVLAWSKYLNERESAKRNGLNHFLTLLESERIPAPLLTKAFELSAYLSIGRIIYKA